MKNWILLFLFLANLSLAKASEITVVTEHYPPYQIVEGSSVTGLSIDIIHALMEEADLEAPILPLSWARAYQKALEGPNVLLFSMIRTEEREKLFKWVGKITGVSGYAFWGLKSSKEIEINNLSDAKQYVIGAPAENFSHRFLKRHGFESFVLTNDFNAALKMLYAGRIQLVINTRESVSYRLGTLNLDKSAIEKKLAIEHEWNHLSIAFSLDTSDEIVDTFRAAYARIKANGTYEKILRKWDAL